MSVDGKPSKWHAEAPLKELRKASKLIQTLHKLLSYLVVVSNDSHTKSLAAS